MEPFFILGAPRSGTTMLRDLFKQIDDVYSPEETHFFRWGCPFRGDEFNSIYQNNGVLRKHRELDGISDSEYNEVLGSSLTKKELTDNYCSLVARKKGKKYWFEKTPQNVYGLPLILDMYESAKIVHIVRNPISVVKSLKEGKVLKVEDVVGAANYWYESVAIINIMKSVMSDRLLEIKYEDLVVSPDDTLLKLSDFLGLHHEKIDASGVVANKNSNGVDLSSDHSGVVEKICRKYMDIYGY